MKNIFTLKSTLIALLVMFCCVMKAETVTYTIDGFTYKLNTETPKATLLGYGGDATEVVVPEFVTYEEKEYRVTWLGERCFYQCSSLVSIKLPSSVTGLGAYCFYECSSLTSIKLPSSVIALGDYCFKSCYSLASIDIPESVEWLGTDCFYGCSSLASIKIPSSVKSLSNRCFYGCSSLTSIEIPASVISLGKYCFAGCDSRESIVVDAGNPKYDSREGCNALIETESNTMILGGKNTRIPDSVTSLEEGCFSYCSSLTSIVIPASLTSLGTSGNCFAGCYSLESIVVDDANPKYDSREGCNAIIETESNTMVAGCKNTIFPESVTSLGNACFAYGSSPTSIVIPESVTSLGSACFSGCSSLTSIKIPSSITSLSDYCFANCSSLTSIVIPESVTSLSDYCFANCSSLTSIVIPESVTSLGNYCFAYCHSLKTVICKMKTVIEDEYRGLFTGTLTAATILYVPEEMLDTYKTTFPWSDFGTILPWTEGMEIIDYTTDDGFSYSLNTKTQEAFLTKYSGETKEVVVPGLFIYEGKEYKVTRLGGNSFQGCSSLTSIEIPESVTSLGNYCFQDCHALKTVICKMKTGIEYAYQFIGTPIEAATLYVPKEMLDTYKTTSPWSDFGTILPWTEGMEIIDYTTDDGFFYSLNTKTQEAFLTKYSGETKEVVVPGLFIYEGKEYKVTRLGGNSFQGCSSITSIDIPSSVTNLGYACFQGCSSLTSIVIPESVTSLGKNCFDGCSSLASIEIPASVTSLSDYCFNGCSSLTSIVIPESVISLGDYCFGSCSSLTSIEIPSSVTSLGYSCFVRCSSLKTVICKMETIKKNGRFLFRLTPIEDVTLYVPEGMLDTYKATSPWSGFGTILPLTKEPEIVEYTTDDGFYYSLDTKNQKASLVKYSGDANEVAIPETITYEGNEYTMTSLGESCFNNCYSLTSIKLPSSVTSLGGWCFDNCRSLASIEIPESVTSLGNCCFLGCSSLASIVIPSSVTSLGESCFNGCYSLESIVVDADNPVYDSREGCNAIIETKSNKMIRGCKNTKIPGSVTSLGDCCFIDCSSLVSIELPSSVTSLGNYCFDYCFALTSIVIPSSVTSLGNYCFGDCSSLKTVICKMENVIQDESLFESAPITDATLYVPEELLAPYKATSPWSGFGTILPLFSLPDATLYLGEKLQMSANVLPGYAENKTLDWSSSNPDVATVDANGNVTAIGIGETTITATVTDGSGVSASCAVTVLPVLAESVVLSSESWSGKLGEGFTLSATVLPENTTDKSVLWSSSDESIATVDAEGNVTTLAVGEATITATATDGSGVSASCHVTVLPILVESLTLNHETWDGMEGESFTLVATLFPENASDKTLVWSTSDATVATVDASGVVTVLKEGSCVVTVLKEGSCVVTVSTVDGSNLSAQCVVTCASGIDGFFRDSDASFDVYNFQGILIKGACGRDYLKQLPTGAYILRQGNASKKIVIR